MLDIYAHLRSVRMIIEAKAVIEAKPRLGSANELKGEFTENSFALVLRI